MINKKVKRRLVIMDGDKTIPVFIRNPVIELNLNEDQSINSKFKSQCKIRLSMFIDNIRGLENIKANIYANKINSSKMQLLSYITDGEDKAFDPSIYILNFILDFCRKYNAIETLEVCIYDLGKLVLPNIPNLKISKDFIVTIRTINRPLKFIWLADKIGDDNYV